MSTPAPTSLSTQRVAEITAAALLIGAECDADLNQLPTATLLANANAFQAFTQPDQEEIKTFVTLINAILGPDHNTTPQPLTNTKITPTRTPHYVTDILNELIDVHHIAVDDIAKAVGVTPHAVTRWIERRNGTTRPNREALARFLNEIKTDKLPTTPKIKTPTPYRVGATMVLLLKKNPQQPSVAHLDAFAKLHAPDATLNTHNDIVLIAAQRLRLDREMTATLLGMHIDDVNEILDSIKADQTDARYAIGCRVAEDVQQWLANPRHIYKLADIEKPELKHCEAPQPTNDNHTTAIAR